MLLFSPQRQAATHEKIRSNFLKLNSTFRGSLQRLIVSLNKKPYYVPGDKVVLS
jgi:hypothetical protein